MVVCDEAVAPDGVVELEGIVVATAVELLILVGVEDIVLESVHFVVFGGDSAVAAVGVFAFVGVAEFEAIVVTIVVELLNLVGVAGIVLASVHFVVSRGYSAASAVGVFALVGAVAFEGIVGVEGIVMASEVVLPVSSNLQATIVEYVGVGVVPVIGARACASSAVLDPIALVVVDTPVVVVVAATVALCSGGSFVGKNLGARHTHRVYDRGWAFVNIVPTGVSRAIVASVRSQAQSQVALDWDV